jgi:glycosyltransferase involved in cell wall biosynthesis
MDGKGRIKFRLGGYEFRAENNIFSIRSIVVAIRKKIWKTIPPQQIVFVETLHVLNRVKEIGLSNIRLVPHPIWAEPKVTAPLESDGFNMLIFGHRPKADKDVFPILDAMKSLSINHHLFIMGYENNPKLDLKIKNYISYNQLTSKVTYNNKIFSDLEKNNLFKKMHAIILPYKNEYNGGSGVLSDAIEFVTPVLSSKASELPDLVEYYNLGLTFDLADSKDFLMKVRALENDHPNFRQLIYTGCQKLLCDRSFSKISYTITREFNE